MTGKKAAFSLLEVLFSIAFLALVGVAVISLNVASLRLVTDSEIKTTAYALNDEAVAFLAMEYKSLATQGAFQSFAAASGCNSGGGCFLRCPAAISPTSVCSLQTTPDVEQLGKSKIGYSRNIVLTETPSGSGNFLVKLKVSWGNSSIDQITTSYMLQNGSSTAGATAL